MSNPYAYYEESLPVKRAEIGFDEVADSGEGTLHEPRVPIVLPLKRGLFGGKATLEATRDQCEISGGSLMEPIVVSREESTERLRLKSRKLIVHTEAGRKYSFRYGRNKRQELALARLETWRRQRWHDAAGRAYESVSELLKKNVIRPLLHKVIVLTVLQSIGVLFIAIGGLVAMQGRLGSDILALILVGVLVYAIPPMVTFALAVALGMRQIWAVYMTMILSFVPLGLSAIALAFSLAIQEVGSAITMLFPILLAVAIIGSSIRVIVRYNSQQAAMENDNHHPPSQAARGLFDKDNQITIELK